MEQLTKLVDLAVNAAQEIYCQIADEEEKEYFYQQIVDLLQTVQDRLPF